MQDWETMIAQRTEAHRESYKPQRIEDPVKRNIRNNQRIKDSTPRRKAQHKAKLVEQESENRRLKRALWMARGYIMTLLNRDFQRLAYQCNNDDYKRNLLRRRNRYYELSEKCLKKAKEYK